MDADPLSKLSAEQLAAINDEQKAIFCSLTEADQNFFAQSFTPNDLPGVLDRKGEINKRNQDGRERMEAFQKQMVEGPAATSTANQKVGDVLTAVAGVVGLGAAAAVVASDNSASWRGVKPSDLVAPLRTEFNTEKSQVNVDGNPNALAVTVMLKTGSGLIPALTVNLTAVNDGTEVKMSDLTSQGKLETLKEGGQKLLDMAGSAINVFARSKMGGVSPEEILSTANQTLSKGASLAEVAGNLKLKDRAWKVIKQTAESVETNYLSEAVKVRQELYTLEKTWDNYKSCATCGVAFGSDDKECRVCGSSRPEKPQAPDPRQPS
jgi:hypothetical protein